MADSSKKDGAVADQSIGAALSKVGVVDAEDTALLSEAQIKSINAQAKANLPKLDPVKDFYAVYGMGKTQFMPSPECWSKIRLIFKISITEGIKEVVDYDGNAYYSYQARGYRIVGDDKVFDVGTKTINFSAKEAEKQIASEEKLEKKYFKSQAEADRWRQKEVIRIRNFGMEMCETGAKNRLTRSLTGFSSGIANDAEKKLLVSEAEDVARVAGGERAVPADKSKALATLFFRAGELKLAPPEVKKIICEKLKVDSLTSVSAKVILREAKDLEKTFKALKPAKEETNGSESKA